MAAVQPLLAANFLSDAAHLLRQAAPETSAYLMSECADHISRQGSSVSDTYRQHVCMACGHIMMPGNEDILRLEARRISRTKQKSVKGAGDASTTGPSKTIACGHCKSVTRVQMSAPEKISRSNILKRVTAVIPNISAETPKPTANSSSKKRAKNRKAGLQALLSSQQKPSGGLSLASFMK